MGEIDLNKYCEKAIEAGFTNAKVIDPASVITAPWVRLKCQFGCIGYGLNYTCPPNTPTHDQTRKVLDDYKRAILFHSEAPRSTERRSNFKKMLDYLVELEGEIFKDGYYKAFLFVAGPCEQCKECGKIKGTPCNFGNKARPSMESCSIDVYQTARNNGLPIQPLKERTETQNKYCLMLVD